MLILSASVFFVAKKNYKKGCDLINENKDKKIRGQKAFLTVNNPQKHNYLTNSPEDMKAVYFQKALNQWGSIIYMCCTKEKGKKGTVHDHLYIHFERQVYITSLQKVFPHCDIEFHNGSDEDNRNYIFKQGEKYENDKAETRIDGFQFEWGEMEKFRQNQGKRNDLEELRTLILQGKSNAEIYNYNANYLKYATYIDKIRLDLIQDKYKKENRFLKVVYQTGETGTGKTRSVMESYGYENVYRVTDYSHPFDSYNLQDTIIFEEFRSSLKAEQMLNYLDLYPVDLPSRYANKVACYHNVYINTNIPLQEQFKNIQEQQPQTWQAFLRRLDEIRVFENNEIYVYKQYRKQDGTFDFLSNNGLLYFDRFNPIQAQ
ncbi:MAG: replication protein [Oscillospiraceae bacterium]|nr:replication protein [Oscillospiraceae bacterium]